MLHFDLESLIRSAGVLGVMLIVFAETGLLVGFFLPGDSLLFTAGFLASQGYLNIWALTIGCLFAAVAGDAVGYAIGKSAGRKLYYRAGSKFFNPEHLHKAERFFERHGGKAVVIARFMPIVRTFVPVVAGMGAMKYPRFALYNILGGLLWAVGVTVSGYAAGHHLPGVQKYMAPVIVAIIALSLLPTVIHVWQEHGGELVAMARAWLAERRAKVSGATTSRLKTRVLIQGGRCRPVSSCAPAPHKWGTSRNFNEMRIAPGAACARSCSGSPFVPRQ